MQSILRGRHVLAILSALLLAGAAMLFTLLHDTGVAHASGSSPYEKSTIVESIKWNEKSKHNLGRGLEWGADIWQTTWASNGNQYSVWGDGEGLEKGANSSLGVAVLEGTPTEATNITGKNVYSGELGRESNCIEKPTKLEGKPHGTVALPGEIIYMFHWAEARAACKSEKDPNPTYLAKSTDNGKEWKDNVGSLKWPDAYGFYPITVLKYGEADAGALAPETGGTQYIYIYGKKTANTGDATAKIYLARVPASPTTDIESTANWTYYEGSEEKGSPKWGSTSEKAAVVLNDENGGNGISVTFDPGIGRYITYDSHFDTCGTETCEPERAVSLFDSAMPWGPWTTITYENEFDNTECESNCLGNDESDSFELPQKWMSASGAKVWSLYSAWPGKAETYDSLNLIEGAMTLSSSGSTIDNIVVKPVGEANGGSPAVLSHLSTTKPEDKLFIDRTYQFTKIPTAYKGLEQLRLANIDKASTSSEYLKFNVTKEENVCIGLDSRTTEPSWLSSWTKQAAEDNIEGEPSSGENVVLDVYKKKFAANATVTVAGEETTNDQYVVFVGC